MMVNTITLKDAVSVIPDLSLAAPVNLSIGAGEHIAIVGENGAGKSLLVEMLIGRSAPRHVSYDFRPSPSTEAYRNIRYIRFRDSYGPADDLYYYQQRWNSMEYEDVPLAGRMLGRYEEGPWQKKIFGMFSITELLEKPVVQLSSGELRKLFLARNLLVRPRVLIIDNPFIGLDVDARDQLDDLLRMLAQDGDVQVILVTSMLESIPDYITHVVPVESCRVGEKVTRKEYLENLDLREEALARECAYIRDRILSLPCSEEPTSSEQVICLNKVGIRYGSRVILDALDWTVLRGEKWALLGPNGSGKSTLLSLVCADNPQAYACDISLFGNKRGSGETIWEIKKHIGYVCPEMHRAFMKDVPAVNVVASGIHDRAGLYLNPKPEQLPSCRFWMDLFGVADKMDKSFLQLSSGEQRLVMLARAFVKDPELLILDEPLHGLDTFNRARVRAAISSYCERKNRTLVMVTHYENELPGDVKHVLRLHRH